MENYSSDKYILMLCALCACIFLPHLDMFFVNIMEARNFITAREMVEYGNYLMPSMNGELRLEKPPLPTWLVALVIKYFGTESIALLRLPAALITFILIYYGYRFIELLTANKLQAFISAGVMATSLYIIYMGRTGTWDIFCHSFMLGGIYYLVKGFKDKKKSFSPFLIAAIFFGLSFMSKGPISFYALLLPFILTYAIFYDSHSFRYHSVALVFMVVITLLISFAWPLLAYYWDQIGAEAIMQKESQAWISRSTKPFWHYWSFPIQSGLWTTFFIQALFFYYIRNYIRNRKEYRLIFWWTLAVVFFLSLVPEKKERYLLPVLIPGAMLIGFYFQVLYRYFHKNVSAAKKIAIPAFIHFGILAILSLAIPILFYFFVYKAFTIALWKMILIGIFYTLLASFLIYQIYRRNVNYLFLGILLFVSSLTIGMIPFANNFFHSNPTFNDFKEVRKIKSVQNLNFYSQEFFRMENVWDVGKEVIELDLVEEAWPGNTRKIGYFTDEPIHVSFNDETLLGIEYEFIDMYDGNHFPKENRQYKNSFVKYFYILTKVE